MKSPLFRFLASLAACLFPLLGSAQVNSGSDGHDGAFNPTQNVTIDMADHPDGIYQYTSVNIPAGVTVTFTPNAKNTPVVWLVQGDCVIGGAVNVSGKFGEAAGGVGGAGGYSGGNGGASPTTGQGPGSGGGGDTGGNAGFGSAGTPQDSQNPNLYGSVGVIYGNSFLLPLIGGSGGGGSRIHPHGYSGGGGGGGAIMIASSSQVNLNGTIYASGNNGYDAGGGSGGSVRIICPKLSGTGSIDTSPGKLLIQWYSNGGADGPPAGKGRVRLDLLENNFGGNIVGAVTTQGFQPIILPVPNQGIQLNIANIGGLAVVGSPGGVLVNPDVIIPAQQANPLNVVVNCTNVPLDTDIIIKVHPANGADVTATAKNTAGTLAASTATIPVAMPHGGGIIYASAVTGIAGAQSATDAKEERLKDLAQTGWTANGERFVAMEITAGMGGKQSVSYLTDSGKHYAMPQ